MELSGKRTLVTGGSSGIGAATVRAYAQAGAAVVSLDVNDRAGHAVAAEADASTPSIVRFLHCDVSDRAEVFAAVDKANDLLGGIDVLAHAAGIEDGARPEEVTEDALRRVWNVNVNGTVWTNQAVFEPMRRNRGGSIINFGSGAGILGAAHLGHYSATKGAVLAWTRSVSKAWMEYGLRANAVAPAIWTPMYDRRRERFIDDEDRAAHDAWRSATMLGGRLGDPDLDMAPVMVFLASDSSRFITGQTIPVNGGSMILT